MSSTNPADALNEAMSEARRASEAMIARAKAPVWYHPVLGLLSAGDVLAYAAPTWMFFVYQPVFFLGLWLLVRAYRRHTGTWVNGWRAGRTRLVAIGFALSFAAGIAATFVAKEIYGLYWPALIAAGAVFVVATAAGFLWEAAYAVDMREEAAL